MLNKVMIIGNLGKDPETRYTAGGQAVTKFSVATSRSWMDKSTNQKKQETEWFNVEVWGKQAEACAEYLAKGRSVYVEGRQKTDSWEDKQTGARRYATKLVAETVRFLGGGPKREEGDGEQREETRQRQTGGGSGPDDIPF